MIPRRIALFSCCIAFCSLVLLGGCSTRSVSVVNESEFTSMARRLTPLLQHQGLLDEGGAYVTPLFASDKIPAAVGESLFARLSPAFRFKVDPALLPATFAAARTPHDTLTMRPDGFVMDRGLESITVALLASVDWNGDGSENWLLLCRVATPRTGGLIDYYLLVEKPDAPVLRPRLLAAWDCRARTCQLFVDMPGRKQKVELDPEAPVIDVEAGEHAVTLPPGTPPPADDKSGAGEKSLREQKLGG